MASSRQRRCMSPPETRPLLARPAGVPTKDRQRREDRTVRARWRNRHGQAP
jgi:hypothetical protein